MDTATPTTQALDLLQLHLMSAQDAVTKGQRDRAIKEFERIQSLARAEALRLSPIRTSGDY